MRHDSHYVDELATATRTIGKTISVKLIEPNPEQPRVEIGDLTDLSASIKEKGVLEPLLVKPIPEQGKWMIIAGERRWRASQIAGLTEVPCIEMDLDERGIAEIALIENLQRKDLTIWEEADGLAALKEKFGYTQDEIAQKISKSRSTVTELMSVAGLPPEIRERCRTSNISSKSVLLEIARQFDEAAMFEFMDNLSNGTHAKKTRPALVGTSVEDMDGSAFKYSSADSGFDLVIKFKKEAADKSKILKALKEVFDKIKASEANGA